MYKNRGKIFKNLNKKRNIKKLFFLSNPENNYLVIKKILFLRKIFFTTFV